MSPLNLHNVDIIFLVLISFLGLILIAVLTIFPPIVPGDLPWRKPLIGSIFSLVCIFGILAVYSPSQCLRILEFRKKDNHRNYKSGKFVSHKLSSSLQGHHPSCGKFSAHIFQIGSRVFCAACTGLLFGGLLNLIGTFLYFFGTLHVAEQNGFLMVLFGILGVGIGLFQFKFRSLVRLLLNAFFVLGALFILIGIDVLIHSLIFDLFMVSLILFWLLTRISLSQWDHKRICSYCNATWCELASWKKERREV